MRGRHPLVAIALATLAAPLSTVAPACVDDSTRTCERTYEHLLGLSRHRPEPDLHERYIEACRATWDEDRHACLLAATTVEEALACRPGRARPG